MIGGGRHFSYSIEVFVFPGFNQPQSGPSLLARLHHKRKEFRRSVIATQGRDRNLAIRRANCL